MLCCLKIYKGYNVNKHNVESSVIVLTIILSFQDGIARRRRLHRWIRIGFLGWILIWMGWYAGAQVTIIHLLNIAQSLIDDFNWGFFLIEPMIFIISAFVAFGLFLIWYVKNVLSDIGFGKLNKLKSQRQNRVLQDIFML